MADLTITAANVAKQGGAAIKTGTAGASITAGQVLCKDTDGTLILASDASATLAVVAGIALHSTAAGQPITYQTAGRINLGATLSLGGHYVLSTAGGISLVDDVAGGEYDSYLGYAESTSILVLHPLNASAAAAAAVV